MNIVFTNDALTLAGGENYVLYLAQGLRSEGHNVIISPLSGSGLAVRAKELDFETLEIPYGSRGREFRCARLLAANLRHRKIDIIHSNSNFDRTASAFAAWMLKCKNIASIHSCFSIRRNITHWFRNKYLIHHFTPVGYSTKRIMVEKDKISEERITVVHIGIPENTIRCSKELRSQARAELNIPEKTIAVGTLSRLVEFKGHTYLLKAAKRLLERHRDLVFVIIGEGELREKLEREANETGFHSRIIFTGHRNDTSLMLSLLDIFAQPSIAFGGETFPVSVIEAQAASLPVIASDTGDIKYIIIDRKTGYLTTPGDDVDLFDKLETLIADPNLRARMGMQARENFCSRLTLPTMIRNMECIYRNVLN